MTVQPAADNFRTLPAHTAMANTVRFLAADAVEKAQGSRAPTQQFVDRFAAIYTPAIFALAVAVALLTPWLMDWTWSQSLYKALVLLVIACPCALVIATPVTVVSGLAASAVGLAGFLVTRLCIDVRVDLSLRVAGRGLAGLGFVLAFTLVATTTATATTAAATATAAFAVTFALVALAAPLALLAGLLGLFLLVDLVLVDLLGKIVVEILHRRGEARRVRGRRG